MDEKNKEYTDWDFSNFYVKERIGNIEVKIPISDNVFTVCHLCGKEFSVDLGEFVDEEFPFELDMAVYCDECSKKLRK